MRTAAEELRVGMAVFGQGGAVAMRSGMVAGRVMEATAPQVERDAVNQWRVTRQQPRRKPRKARRTTTRRAEEEEEEEISSRNMGLLQMIYSLRARDAQRGSSYLDACRTDEAALPRCCDACHARCGLRRHCGRPPAVQRACGGHGCFCRHEGVQGRQSGGRHRAVRRTLPSPR